VFSQRLLGTQDNTPRHRSTRNAPLLRGDKKEETFKKMIVKITLINIFL
jgi:hypothetical protein